jgi:methylenetetrahydrofolate dehydrogenase (NADP+)/methenyltetrahydrofolate cyclohydrolase
MAATIMDGRALAERIRAEVAAEVMTLGGTLGLATVLVGDDPASDIYIRNKHKAALEAGIDSRDHRLPSDTSEEEVLGLIAELNEDDAIDAILVQMPLPSGIDENRVIRAVEPIKDVDGFHPFNAGQLYLGEPTHVPATPLGILALLDEYGVKLEGAKAVVIGRSEIVGKPVAHLLLQENATVTICHSRTPDLGAEARQADVLVVAAGRRDLVRAADVKERATVVDVGINRTDHGIVGDVDPAAVERAAFITPVPGGVGPMTIAMLLRSTVRAAMYRRNLLAFPRG